MPKNKKCKQTVKITGFSPTLIFKAIDAIGTVVGTIGHYCGKAVETAAEGGKMVLGAAAVVLGFIAPPIWFGAKYLTQTGFNALYNLLTELYKDTKKKTINTKNVKELLRDIKRKILTKNPQLKNSAIMYDINELNKLCYYIDNMNEAGMTKLEYEDCQWKLTNDVKALLIEFGKVMKS